MTQAGNRCRHRHDSARRTLRVMISDDLVESGKAQAKKMAGRETSHNVVIDNYNQRRTS